MYKNQLQELAQRSCFNLPCYTCTREGPDHAPRFKACVNFNGEIFHAPTYCTTLRQAEHAAAEVALNALSTRVPSRFLAAKVLDEIGVYKNLLQESVHRAGLNLPVYTTERSGPGHLPVFISIVELAGMNFTGESARTKKQAEKNAAMAAWSALRQLSNVASSTTSQTNKESECCEEQEHVVVARVLSKFRPKDENRTPRQSDQNQVRRRRMVSSYRDNNNNNNNSVSSSSRAFMQQQQQWRQGMSSCEFSSKPQKQQRGSIIAHLSSTTSSKMLLPTSSSTDRSSSSYSVCPSNKTGIQVEVRSKSQVMIQDIPTPLEEHQKDEDEWLYGRVDTDSIIEKSMEKSCNSTNSNSVTRPIVVTCQYRPFIGGHHAHENTRSIFAGTMCYGPPPSVQMLNGGGGYHGHGHGHGIAPPVHIRSVIPVCAAPPPSNSQIAVAPAAAQKKQQDISGSESSSVLKKQTEEEEAAAAARSKLNDLHL